ncbi:Helix-turn-helix domain [Streptococcus dysgalactiae]|nr:Helix-turn-helix domain [Streptococcus dysgalactiae]
MGVFTDEFKGDIAMAVREEFKVSFVEFLSKESAERRWVSIDSAAHYADCSSNTIRKWIRMGLNLYQIDGTKRIKKDELDEFIESHQVI